MKPVIILLRPVIGGCTVVEKNFALQLRHYCYFVSPFCSGLPSYRKCPLEEIESICVYISICLLCSCNNYCSISLFIPYHHQLLLSGYIISCSCLVPCSYHTNCSHSYYVYTWLVLKCASICIVNIMLHGKIKLEKMGKNKVYLRYCTKYYWLIV